MTDQAKPLGRGLAWSWSLCLLGAVLGLPGALMTIVNAPFGLALAVGVIPAAANRLAPTRSGRWMSVLVGTAAGASMLLGSVLTQIPVLAVAALFVLGVAAPLWARRSRLGGLVVALCLPLVGIGLSFDDIGTAAVLSLLMVAGSVYAWLVSLLWPEHPAPVVRPAAPAPLRLVLGYGVLLGIAGALAASIGYVLSLEHVGWATGACLLVMRPHRSMLFLRSAGRALSVIAGAMLAAVVAVVGPPALVLAVLVLSVVAAATATQGSRWYVTPGFTTFLALSMIIRTSPESPLDRFNERMFETLLGIAIALVFGWAVPVLLTRLRRRTSKA